MHIPENYLSPQSCALCFAVVLPFWRLALRRTRAELSPAKIPLVGIGAAFAFLGMMFNIPFPGGTTGHAVGGTLLAVLLGPDAACLALTIALVLQALLFGDGGVLAIGANCLNIAVLLPYSGYAVYKKLQQWGWSQQVSAAAGSYIGINLAALLAAVEFGLQPVFFKDALGRALYCPYGLEIAVPAMLLAHLTVFGLAEMLFTVAVLCFLRKAVPQLWERTEQNKNFSYTPLLYLLVAMVLLTPLGLLAEGTAWGEWGKDELPELGYVPQGMEQGWEWKSLLPDYGYEGMPEIAAYILSAALGVGILLILGKLWAAGEQKKTDFS